MRQPLCLALVAFLVTVSSQSYDYGVELGAIMRRQNPSARVLVGKLPLAPNGSTPVRPEIRDMKKDPYAWNLYILAQSMLQYVGQDESLSWYQIAGIHGVPFVPWNGVPAASGAAQSGYCTHSSILFPMWHRPYLALYEQEMFKLANAIANLFANDTERSLYQHAASQFRIPYWDWSIPAPAGETHFPDVFWSPVISQYGPNGIQNIRNPLYSYNFHPLDEKAMIWDPLKHWNETKRAPDTAISATAPPSENYQVSAALLSKLPEIQQRLYILFSSYHDFNAFSNKAWSASQRLSTLDSIESVHDIIHMYGGMKGHMTYVPLSSFDPLFFLHHTMTDRLIAMWQVLNPNAWITPMASGETSYTAVKGTIQGSATALAPFYATEDGMFWTSDMARNLEVFGYTYADTSPHVGDKDAVRQSLVGKINSWYGTSSPAGIRAKQSDRKQAIWRTGSSGSRFSATDKFQPNIKLTAEDPSADKVVHNDTYFEWAANVQVNVEALDGVFGVHFFIGATPSDERNWNSAPNHVGSVSIFAMNRKTGSQSKISGSVPLTTALMKLVAAEELSCLSKDVVLPFLQRHLEIRVLGGNDTSIDLKRVDGLRVSITSAQVRLPETGTSFPEWGDVVTQWEAWRS